MDIPEPQVHSFIVKLWLERAGDEAGAAAWHGHITHVPSGERRYLKDYHDILSFVRLYVGETGSGEAERDSRPRSWLRPWARRKR